MEFFHYAWNKIAKPNISAGVLAKTKNPQADEIASQSYKSTTSGKVFNLTDLHGNGLR